MRFSENIESDSVSFLGVSATMFWRDSQSLSVRVQPRAGVLPRECVGCAKTGNVFGAVNGLYAEAFVGAPHQFLLKSAFEVGFHLGTPLCISSPRETGRDNLSLFSAIFI